MSHTKVSTNLDNDTLSSFIPMQMEIPHKIENSKCTRFLRKKHQCLIIYALLSIVFLQTSMSIITKIDDKAFNDVISYFSNLSVRNVNSEEFFNCTCNNE